MVGNKELHWKPIKQLLNRFQKEKMCKLYLFYRTLWFGNTFCTLFWSCYFYDWIWNPFLSITNFGLSSDDEILSITFMILRKEFWIVFWSRDDCSDWIWYPLFWQQTFDFIPITLFLRFHLWSFVSVTSIEI